MQNLTTPSISALESISPDLLLLVSGGCEPKCRKPKRCRPSAPPAPAPPPPTPVPTLAPPPPPPQQQQQMAGGNDEIINNIVISYGGTTRTA